MNVQTNVVLPTTVVTKSRRSGVSLNSTVTIWLIAALLFLGFSILAPGFASVFNISNFLSEGVLIGFLAVGLTPVIISGNIDLSVGSTLGLVACLAVGLQGYGLSIALFISVLAGCSVGLLNGLLIERAGVNSFIVTLATMLGVRGLTFLYTGDQSLTATSDSFVNFGSMTIGPISVDVVVLLVFAALVWWMLLGTVHGRNTYAIGGNRRASEDAGVPVSLHVIGNMILSGFAASLCGLAMSANLGVASPSFGRDYELLAITAVVLGGVRLRGGTGSIIGTLGAVLALTILRNGMDLMHVPPFYIPVVMGLALIAALIADRRKGGLTTRYE
jgi:ribose transport system permease protein